MRNSAGSVGKVKNRNFYKNHQKLTDKEVFENAESVSSASTLKNVRAVVDSIIYEEKEVFLLK